jgi:iduronate 2-sulfatase
VKEIDRLDLWRNTIVIFTSDHGMHVGEKGIWGKWSLFDESTS